VLGGARIFAVVLPAAVSYYLTVATADNWAGPVCNLGRFFMPVSPLAVALVGVALARVGSRRGALALALILAGWSAVFALALRQDPIAANDSALLLAKSTFADGNVYIPNLWIPTWARGAPGLLARILAWLAAIGLATVWLRRVSRSPRAGRSPVRVLAATAGLLLVLGVLLERWPGRPGPVLHDALPAGDGALAFLRGDVRVREDEAIVGPGRARLLLRSPKPVSGLRVLVGGHGVLEISGEPPLVLRPAGARVTVPLLPFHTVRGRGGEDAVYLTARVAVRAGQAVLRVAGRSGGGESNPGNGGEGTGDAAGTEEAEPGEGNSR